MNQQILSQDEVDALLQGITGESQTTSADDAPAADKSGVREYDIANQERIVRGRMPTMDAINERFARNLRHTLFELLRAVVFSWIWIVSRSPTSRARRSSNNPRWLDGW